MKVVLIQYNSGNVQSVLYALERLGVEAELTDNPGKILSADRVIFPGQGEASSAMSYLKDRNLDKVIREIKQPFLGVCLGLQLLCAHSEENDTDCLGIFPIKVRRFIPSAGEKVPHVGWNKINSLKENPLLNNCQIPGTCTMCIAILLNWVSIRLRQLPIFRTLPQF